MIAHVYGHHVAAHRSNVPWPALAWGTKRWASYEQVCRRARAHELFPGAEGGLVYLFNPGEVFAETFRLLNERKAGIPETPWRVVDNSLVPNDRDLALVEQDVTQPWSANRTLRFLGGFTARGSSVRSFKVATPLDGTFTASVQSAVAVRLDVLNGKKRVAWDDVGGGNGVWTEDADVPGDANVGKRCVRARVVTPLRPTHIRHTRVTHARALSR